MIVNSSEALVDMDVLTIVRAKGLVAEVLVVTRGRRVGGKVKERPVGMVAQAPGGMVW